MKLPKETNLSDSSRGSSHGRWYDDACGTAFAMELVGERWSLLVIRELMLGGLRFSDLRASLPGISAKVLTERLASLEATGAVVKRKLPPPSAVQVYELTDWGRAAEPAIQELGRWAAQSMRHDPTLPLSPVSLMLSFRTMLNREKAREFEADIGFDIGGQQFRARLANGELPIVRQDVAGAKVIFRAPVAPLIAAHFYRKTPVAELAPLMMEGDAALSARFVDLFHLPAKIG